MVEAICATCTVAGYSCFKSQRAFTSKTHFLEHMILGKFELALFVSKLYKFSVSKTWLTAAKLAK